MKKENVENIFNIFEKSNPNPTTELNFTNNFTLLVSVVLSAQSTDVSVNKATESLFKVADTPEKMLELGEEQLKDYIKTIGLYKNKSRNVIKLSKTIIEEHNSEVPDDFNSLIQLPGVGVKTANVILNCAFGKPTIAVDTHVFRVSNRTGLVLTKTPEKTEEPLLKIIPNKWKKNAHHWLILHGRYVCKAKKPDCSNCHINKYCEYDLKTSTP